MFSFFMDLSYYMQAFIAGIFTFMITVMGSALVFFFKKDESKLFNVLLAFSAGIMLSAAFFSLINPAFSLCESLHINSYLICFLGIMAGTLLLYFGERFTSKSNELMLSITLHNIPEGLSIGVAFGSIFYGIEGATLMAALILTLGIAIQNFPEGSAVSLPLLKNGYSPLKAFLYGALTACVEPISALLGAVLVMKIQIILPFCLTFAAGAMIYVVVNELVPSCMQKNSAKMSFFILLGFAIMMVLEILFS